MFRERIPSNNLWKHSRFERHTYHFFRYLLNLYIQIFRWSISRIAYKRPDRADYLVFLSIYRTFSSENSPTLNTTLPPTHNPRFSLITISICPLLQCLNQHGYRSLRKVRSIPYFIDVVCKFFGNSLKVVRFKGFLGLRLLLLHVAISTSATSSYLMLLYLGIFAIYRFLLALCCRLSLRRR